jgi:hypothetical protein
MKIYQKLLCDGSLYIASFDLALAWDLYFYLIFHIKPMEIKIRKE